MSESNETKLRAAPSEDEQRIATLPHCANTVPANSLYDYDLPAVLRDAAARLQELACAPSTETSGDQAPSVDDLAQQIRRVDGSHSLGAGALAEALMPFLARWGAPQPASPVAVVPVQRFNNRAGLMNPEGNGLYVRYEDHSAALATAAPAPQLVERKAQPVSDIGAVAGQRVAIEQDACHAYEQGVADASAAALKAMVAEVESWAVVPAHFHGAMKRKLEEAIRKIDICASQVHASLPAGDMLAARALAKSYRENPREAGLADQAVMGLAAQDPLRKASQAHGKSEAVTTGQATAQQLEAAWRDGWACCRDAEFVGEQAEGDAWGSSSTNYTALDIEQDRIQRPAAPAAEAAVVAVQPLLVINGYQLRDALDFLAPDGTAEQLEQEVCIQPGPERTHDEGTDAAGLYCWLSEYPEEGSMRLDDVAAPSNPSQSTGDSVRVEGSEAKRDAIGQALSDYMTGHADEGTFSIDPFDAREVDALADVVLTALAQQAAPAVEGCA